jgi:hypothetical protein
MSIALLSVEIEKGKDTHMKFFKIFLTAFTAAAFFTACNSLDQLRTSDPYPNDATEAGLGGDNNWARENLDLQAVGGLLEKADDAEEFEYLLNSEDGVNNLDLNGDGYADYISVREFDDRYDDQRGFSLFSQFGPDLIQEIAQIIFYRDRDRYNYPGSRVLLIGNDQIYGDNYYYETDWYDRSYPIVTWMFGDRDNYYRSPYYYGYYPDYYEVYPVVDTPVYITRVREYYYEPVFVRTEQPPVYISQIKIKSPNYGKSMDKIYSKLAKPTREQVEFRKNNPNKPVFVPVQKGNPNRADFKEKGNPNRFEVREKVNPKRFEVREKGNPNRVDAPKGNPNRTEKVVIRQNPNPNRIERVQPNRIERPNIKPQGNPNRQINKPQGNPNKQSNPGGGNKGGGKGGGKKP